MNGRRCVGVSTRIGVGGDGGREIVGALPRLFLLTISICSKEDASVASEEWKEACESESLGRCVLIAYYGVYPRPVVWQVSTQASSVDSTP